MKVKRLRGQHWLALRVEEVGEGGAERTVVLEDAWLKPLLTPQFQVAGEGVYVALRASRVANNLDVKGVTRTRVLFQCSRCGGDGELPLETGFEVLFVAEGAHNVNLAGEGEGAELQDDFVMGEIQGGVADVEPALAEALVLAMPPYPLCTPHCKGVCGSCGANLNEEPCRCPAPATESRWAALEKLRDRLPPSGGAK